MSGTAADRPPSRSLLQAAALFYFGSLWLVFRPYLGIYHDARLYAFQALRSLDPAQFSSDLYFRYGSQDTYTALSPVYGALAAVVGIDHATILLVIFSQSLFLAGLWLLSRVVIQGGPRWIFLFGVAVLPGFYFNLQQSYAESFLNARPPAEGLVLCSLAALLAGRPGWWAVLGTAAAVVHPLVAVSGWMVAGWYLALGDRRWLALPIIGAAAGLGLALLGLNPFANLFLWFDSEWSQLAAVYVNVVYLHMMTEAHWFSVLWSTTVIAVGFKYADAGQRRLLAAAAGAAVSGYLATFVGADLLGNALLTQLQLHRALWIFQLVSYLALARLAWAAFEKREGSIIALSWLLAARLIPSVSMGLFLMAGFAVFWLAHEKSLRLPSWLKAAGWLPLPLWMAGGLAAAHLLDLPQPGLEGLSFKGVDPQAVRLVFLAPAAVGLLLAALALLRKGGEPTGWIPRLLVASGAAALFISAAWWDQRDDLQRRLERSYGQQRLLEDVVEAGSDVYWDDRHLLHVWFLMGHPSYVSGVQGAGMIYSREMALEWRRRMRVVGASGIDQLQPSTDITAPPLGPSDLGSVCRDAELDYVVTVLPTDASTAFEIVGETYYLNDCREYR